MEEMLKAGLIRPSSSPHGAPTFCVKKAVGWCIVHDYRAMNNHTFRMRDADIKYTAFQTADRSYEYL
ncbi:hypothetical protein PHMEG_00018097 [Phytophthora megakarya]|uniref:Reverse transcriptase n=1 Tax=Phytophthora megakarya TaxID=4795 RepID=A0A225VUW7_9STRA|nr:hypothetical protein PHMEG_00018097 [Phytophthora megakarya]